MARLFLGILVLGLFLLAARWFANANPASLAKSVKATVVTLLVLLAVALVATGRAGWAIAALGAAVPWLMRLLHMHAMWRAAKGYWDRFASQGQPSGGQTSRVDSRFLRMELDHDSGRMDGEVLEGTLAGRRLSTLAFAEAAALWRECGADGPSRQLMEAWLDREHPDWLARIAEEAEPGAAGAEQGQGGGIRTAAMTRKEALAMLGLEEGASREEIKAAYRRLMSKLHPDHGGSAYLAARLNEAKEVLLSGRRG